MQPACDMIVPLRRLMLDDGCQYLFGYYDVLAWTSAGLPPLSPAEVPAIDAAVREKGI
jgi:hypothetical protein